MTSSIKWTIAQKTDQGKKRTNNEDSILVNESLGLLIVADGMGGHQSGEVASRMATQLIHENMKHFLAAKTQPKNTDGKWKLPTRQLASSVRLANQAIFEAGKQYLQDRGMGTTLTAALLNSSGYLSVAHIGDSRAYIFRNGALKQITADHSLVMDQVRQGLITETQAKTSNQQNVLSRALGIEEKVEIDAEEHPLMPGDMILLCSDGLNRMVTDEEILAIIQTAKEPASICETLVEAANAAGGHDNISVVVAQAQKASLLTSIKTKWQNRGKKE